jgi:lactate 2-monooxygenase
MGSSRGRERQAEVYGNGVRGRRPAVPTGAARLEQAAKERMSDEAFAYVAGGAGLEATMAANRQAFLRRRIVPRILRGASERDLGVELYGRRLASPLLLAPVGVLEMAHGDADLAVARAAAAEGVPMIFSSQASVPMERCAEAMGSAPRWFQLYCSTSDAIVESFVHRATACRCEAIVLTLDTTLLGWRTRDLDLGSLPFLRGKGIAQYTSDPVFNRLLDDPPGAAAASDGHGTPSVAGLKALLELNRRLPGGTVSNLRSGRARAAVRLFLDIYSRPSLSWDDLAYVRRLTRLPLLVKGVLDPGDARLAVEHGADGIVVSNHGGRQIDGGLASLDALAAIVDAVEDRVPVLLDSGVRGGADAFKALALGARAVLIGRPYVYGLAVAGERGVREVLANFVAELDLTMGLAGCRSIAEITGDAIDE